jgi:tetratricopeptide (TPR) repeat protein
MAEFIEESEVEAEAALNQSGSAAMEIALNRASRRGAGKRIDAKTEAFLDEQTELIRLQKEHLHEQRELQVAHLKVRRWKDRLSLAVQAMGLLVGAAVVIGLGVMVWQAHEASGLIVDAFSVPPDLARDGLTGQVAAGRFLDRLQALQAATATSDRPAQSFQDDWGSQIKVEIPETGLTFGEIEKLLRERLGHVSHVSGEVLKTPSGFALTARIGGAPPQTFTGAESDFDGLAQKAAEAVYRQSQPYRFAEYLDRHGRSEEAFQVISDLAANGPASERGWAYAFWSLLDVNDHGDVASARLHAARGLGYGPGSDIEDRIGIVNTAVWAGDEETDLVNSRILQVETRTRAPDSSPVFFNENKLLATAWLQFILPDYRASAAAWTQSVGIQSMWTDSGLAVAMTATALALDHDPAGARKLFSASDEIPLMPRVATGAFLALPLYWSSAESGDWPAALADARRVDGWLEANRAQHPIYRLMQQVWIRPLEALAQARAGDLTGAQDTIGKTTLDCYLCLRVRGQIAAQASDWPSAEHWFAEAVRQGPSVTFAYADWGRMLLDKGDADRAIAKLQLAHARAPHFADPLETWGEALLKKGDAAGAAARFREAARYAPNWALNRRMLAKAEGHG